MTKRERTAQCSRVGIHKWRCLLDKHACEYSPLSLVCCEKARERAKLNEGQARAAQAVNKGQKHR